MVAKIIDSALFSGTSVVMSNQVNQLFFSASSEFTALCRSQVTNLQEGLNADRSAVYLTKEFDSGTRHLIPIVVYPDNEQIWEETIEESTIIPPEEGDSFSDETPSTLPSTPPSEQMIPQLNSTEQNVIPDVSNQHHQHQIVFPLLHENVMMGLLVVARQQAQWSDWEFSQIQRTAGTIALACVLDQRNGLSQQKLRQQQLQQQTHREQLDDIVHQLRNPLTALRTFGKLLLKRFKSEQDAKSRSLTENIMRESDRLQQLLQDMGDYLDQMEEEEEVTIERDTPALPEDDSQTRTLPPSSHWQLEAVPLADILNPILDSTRAIAQEKAITLKSNIAENVPPVQANHKALQEVLNNLVDNAIKYTPQKGTIEVNLIQNQSPWQGIMIRDDGAGIPPSDQSKIFQRHYRGVQSESSIPGTGLGLAIAKDYVEQMGGEIELISPATPPDNPTHGTAFIVWLPNQSQA